MGGKIEKSHGGPPPGPRGGAEAGVRREAPNGGRSGAPRARRDPHLSFLKFEIRSRNNIMLLSKKVRDTQPHPRYSAKNNDAIRMIASFMSILFLFQPGIPIFSETFQISGNQVLLIIKMLRLTK